MTHATPYTVEPTRNGDLVLDACGNPVAVLHESLSAAAGGVPAILDAMNTVHATSFAMAYAGATPPMPGARKGVNGHSGSWEIVHGDGDGPSLLAIAADPVLAGGGDLTASACVEVMRLARGHGIALAKDLPETAPEAIAV